MLLNRLLIIIGVASPIACGQLYVLTGSPSNNHPESFASSLYRIQEGSVRQVGKDLVSQAVGIEWVGLSYDWRKAVIVARHDYTNTDLDYSDSIIVIDFDSVPAMKRCKLPFSPEMGLINSWLADTPAGPSYEWQENGEDPRKDVVVKGFLLDSAVPCEKSFARLSPDAVRHVIEDGYPGVADVATSSRPFVRANPDDESDNSGNVNAWIGGKPIPLGYQIPEALRKGMNIKITNLTINDSHVFAVGIGDGRGRYRDLLFRKSDRTWHTFPMAAEVDNVRGFGKYIATMEVTKPKSVDALSAGMERWRPEAGKMGPQLAGRVALSGHFYPGKLFLYDVDTERVFPIVTNDGDSEVLLVENNIVYYRASDRLYSAVIEKDHVGRGQLLVTNDVIRDAHWAFIKH